MGLEYVILPLAIWYADYYKNSLRLKISNEKCFWYYWSIIQVLLFASQHENQLKITNQF